MRLQQFVLGELMVNSYLFWEEESKEAIVIDPGDPVDQIISSIQQEGLNVVGIVLTHGHYDHITGVSELKSRTKAGIYVHSGDAPMLGNPTLNLSSLFNRSIVLKPDYILGDGEVISLGSSILTVRYAPGHTQGGICLLGDGLVFSGDSLFAGSIGRTDLPGGNLEDLSYSVRSLLFLPDQTRVFPGHGQETTIGRERRDNPFLQELRKGK